MISGITRLTCLNDINQLIVLNQKLVTDLLSLTVRAFFTHVPRERNTYMEPVPSCY